MQRYTGGRACLAADPQYRRKQSATGSGAAAASALGREDSHTLDGIMDAMARVDAMLRSCEEGCHVTARPATTATAPVVRTRTAVGMTVVKYETEASEETGRSVIVEEEQMAVRRMFV